MNITVLNGNPADEKNGFTPWVSKLVYELERVHNVSYFPLSRMNIKQCRGCWNCWWKTPGICSLNDEAEPVMKAVIHSELVIFASPLIAGFTSSTLKTTQDRLIALLHPYIELVDGECHHRKRYESYPDFALLLQKEADTDEEDIKIITDIYHRLAINFHCKLKDIWFTETHKTEKIAHEISHI